MAFLKLNGHDYSPYTKELNVTRSATYRAQTNAAGDSTVDRMNPKYEIEFSIIPISDDVMKSFLQDIYSFNVTLQFRSPLTNEMETINAIIPDSEIQYMWIQSNSVMYREFTIKASEL